MNKLLCLLLPLLVAAAGCVTKSTAKAQTQAAYLAGQAQSQQQGPSVFMRGEFRRRTVPWGEGMTLAQALAAAEYTGWMTPRQIIVTRQGQPTSVDPNQLLRGFDNPLLEAGDVVEVHH